MPFRPPDGTPVPDGLRILDVAGERVLGMAKDEMDVESVLVYELMDAN